MHSTTNDMIFYDRINQIRYRKPPLALILAYASTVVLFIYFEDEARLRMRMFFESFRYGTP